MISFIFALRQWKSGYLTDVISGDYRSLSTHDEAVLPDVTFDSAGGRAAKSLFVYITSDVHYIMARFLFGTGCARAIEIPDPVNFLDIFLKNCGEISIELIVYRFPINVCVISTGAMVDFG